MKVLFCFVLALTSALSINGQNLQKPTELKGTVYDQTGAVIPSTRIVVSNQQGQKFQTSSGDDGTFTIRVPAGTYVVEAEWTKTKGFEKFRIEKYEMPSATQMVLDICLRVDMKWVEINVEPIVRPIQ